MEQVVIILSILVLSQCKQDIKYPRQVCDTMFRPLEVGTWKHFLIHLDSGVVENKPVTINEGQVYVYENEFPGYTIKYIHVDNLAIRTCGAHAEIKSGGIGKSSVLIVIHAKPNNEIRSVVEIWGVKNPRKPVLVSQLTSKEKKNLRSLYVQKGFRAVSHNVNY